MATSSNQHEIDVFAKGQVAISGHGLWYITRDDMEAVRLDTDPDLYPSLGSIPEGVERLPKSELYVLRALLNLALERISGAIYNQRESNTLKVKDVS